MNTSMSAARVEAVKNNLRIKALLDKLRNKLKNFSVLDSSGHLVGEVKDVKLDPERQLNLVVSQADSYSKSGLCLLKSRHIQQVDSVSKTLFVDISKAEISRFVEYIPPAKQEVTSLEPSLSPATVPPVIDRDATPISDAIPHKIVAANLVPTEEVRFHADDIAIMNEPQYPSQEFENHNSLNFHETEFVEEEVVRLLGERLIVDRNRRKVGEVIVRKEVETRMVEVPIRYEKLIVEQVSPERKQLAEIQLTEENLTGVELSAPMSVEQRFAHQTTNTHAVSGEFLSPKSASLFLNAIALQRHHGCAKVRVELVLEDEKLEKTYREWFDRCSGS